MEVESIVGSMSRAAKAGSDMTRLTDAPDLRVNATAVAIDSTTQRVACSVTNVGSATQRVDFLNPVSFRIPFRGRAEHVRFLVHGLHSFSGSGSFAMTSSPPKCSVPMVDASSYSSWCPPQGRDGVLVSSMVGALGSASPAPWTVTVGCAGLGAWNFQVVAQLDDHAVVLHAVWQTESIGIDPGETLEFPGVWVSTADPAEAFTRWAAETAPPAPPRSLPDGYCSWYRHYTHITERQLLDDLEAVQHHFGEETELFHIDDGYQRQVGDWLSYSEGFPRGVGPIIDAAHGAGFKAGLWLAPLFALHDSEVAKQHPDWLVRDASGRPVVGMLNPGWDRRHPVRVLDATHPEVLGYLEDVFSTYRGIGVDLFKLDFLYAGLLRGRRFQSDRTTLEGLRAALQVIRGAVGEDAFLMGCGAPPEAVCGLVDGWRSSSDVTPSWRQPFVTKRIGRDFETLGTNLAHRNVLIRAVLHRRWFDNDPDCLFAYHQKCTLSAAERRLLWHTNAVAGGPLMYATDASEFGGAVDELRDAYRLNREVKGHAEQWWCPDMLTSAHPEVLVASGPDRSWVAIANMTEVAGDRRIPIRELHRWDKQPQRCHVIDAASPDQVMMTSEELVVLGLGAHDSVVVELCRD